MRESWEWTEDDILSLIHNKIGESTTLEYKACDALAKTENKKREISKDVSAFANSAGGTIVYGVTENSSHEPERIDFGFDQSDISGEWLEQVINSNIERRISGIIINTVHLPKTQPGKVLYVVYIPESKLAPHMAADDRFYKRFNFQSVTMKEYEVRNLMRQETFPSRDVVCAWRDYVINPLLSTVSSERYYLEGKWTWDRWKRRDIGLKELDLISNRSTYSGNQEQFLEAYPGIQEAMEEHDSAVKELNERVEQLFVAIKENDYFRDLYLKTTTSEALQPLKDAYHNELEHCSTDEAILDRMFSSKTSQDYRLGMLAEYIVNQEEPFNSDRTTMPFWNTHREKCLQIINYPPISDYWSAAAEAKERLQQQLKHLIAILKKTRSELTKQYGVPVESPPPAPVIYGNLGHL